jgi:hypothetical protein
MIDADFVRVQTSARARWQDGVTFLQFSPCCASELTFNLPETAASYYKNGNLDDSRRNQTSQVIRIASGVESSLLGGKIFLYPLEAFTVFWKSNRLSDRAETNRFPSCSPIAFRHFVNDD